jgi:hypothetical protein
MGDRMSEWNNAAVDWVKAGELIQELRNDEGSMVGICCDNADFDGPNSAIVVQGSWTDYQDKMIYGDSVIQCLETAVAERRQYARR